MTIEEIIYELDEGEKITDIKYQVKNNYSYSTEEINEEDIDGIYMDFGLSNG